MNIKLDISESFYHGEERCGYYVSPEMKKVWAVELDLIAEFARVCEKYNLKWYVHAGTLLGAARHKGFIPWDDDFDIMMMRSDYEKLCSIAQNEFHPPYSFRRLEDAPSEDRVLLMGKLYNSDTSLFAPYAARRLKAGKKLNFPLGIFIDIFPLYDISDDRKVFMRLYKKAKFLRLLSNFAVKITDNYSPSKSMLKYPVKAIAHYALKAMKISLPYKTLMKRFIDIINSSVCPDSEYVAELNWAGEKNFMHRRMMKRSFFNDTVYMPFEMLNIPAPSGYDEILTQLYGNWHEIKIRHTHGVFFDTEHSYRYYTQEGNSFGFKEFKEFNSDK